MIGIIFRRADEVVEVRIDICDVVVRSTEYGNYFYPLETLQFSKTNIFKIYPDLEGKENWKTEAIIRFKDKLKQLRTDEERAAFISDDMKLWGYTPVAMQKSGHRPIKL